MKQVLAAFSAEFPDSLPSISRHAAEKEEFHFWSLWRVRVSILIISRTINPPSAHMLLICVIGSVWHWRYICFSSLFVWWQCRFCVCVGAHMVEMPLHEKLLSWWSGSFALTRSGSLAKCSALCVCVIKTQLVVLSVQTFQDSEGRTLSRAVLSGQKVNRCPDITACLTIFSGVFCVCFHTHLYELVPRRSENKPLANI